MRDYLRQILSWIKWIYQQIKYLVNLVPNQASASNQLADKAFVNSSVQTATANFRGSWSNWVLVPEDSSLYPTDYAGSHIPTTNDYLVVQDASDYIGEQSLEHRIQIVNLHNSGKSYTIKITGDGLDGEYRYPDYLNWTDINASYQLLYAAGNPGLWLMRSKTFTKIVVNSVTYDVVDTGVVVAKTNSTDAPIIVGLAGITLAGTWRFKYSGLWATDGKNGWQPEYQVNEEPLTAAQIAALNSGITSTQVTSFANKQDTISDLSEIRENAELGKEAYNGLDNKLNIIKEIEEDVYLYPGHYYQLADTTGSIDIALCEYDGYSNVEYTFFFVCEGTINFAFYINDIPGQPISPQWNRQFSPVSGKSYEVSISINNEGAYGAFLEF